jgi:hypothetical protein
MKKVIAEFNHARWIALCPDCLKQGIQSALEVKPGDVFVCPEEHPNLLATTFVPNPRMPGAFNSVPDVILRRETLRAALDAGEAYQVTFPADKAQIERALRMRPRNAQNWFPGTTVAELLDENERRGVKHA